MNGIALGMTAETITKLSPVPCRPSDTDLVCEEPGSETSYKIMMSGGKPSVALSVTENFCSATASAAVLAGLLKTYGVGAKETRPNPNGASFDIGATVEGNLNWVEGSCKAGEKPYHFVIQDVALMKVQGGAGGGASPQP